MGRRKLGACFQPENSGPEGGASSQAPAPLVPPGRKQPSGPSPAGSSQRQDRRAVGCGGARASAHSSALRARKGPPLGRGAQVPRWTHGIKEVLELVLLEAGSQQVVGCLQHTLFEPEGGGLMLTGRHGEHRCDCQLSPAVPPPTHPRRCTSLRRRTFLPFHADHSLTCPVLLLVYDPRRCVLYPFRR